MKLHSPSTKFSWAWLAFGFIVELWVLRLRLYPSATYLTGYSKMPSQWNFWFTAIESPLFFNVILVLPWALFLTNSLLKFDLGLALLRYGSRRKWFLAHATDGLRTCGFAFLVVVSVLIANSLQTNLTFDAGAALAFMVQFALFGLALVAFFSIFCVLALNLTRNQSRSLFLGFPAMLIVAPYLMPASLSWLNLSSALLLASQQNGLLLLLVTVLSLVAVSISSWVWIRNLDNKARELYTARKWAYFTFFLIVLGYVTAISLKVDLDSTAGLTEQLFDSSSLRFSEYLPSQVILFGLLMFASFDFASAHQHNQTSELLRYGSRTSWLLSLLKMQLRRVLLLMWAVWIICAVVLMFRVHQNPEVEPKVFLILGWLAQNMVLVSINFSSIYLTMPLLLRRSPYAPLVLLGLLLVALWPALGLSGLVQPSSFPEMAKQPYDWHIWSATAVRFGVVGFIAWCTHIRLDQKQLKVRKPV